MKEPQDYLTYLKKISQKKTYLRHLDTETKNKVLLRLAQKLLSHSSSLLDFNKKDLLNYQQSPHFQKAFEDRLTLTPQRLEAMAQGLRVVATLPEVNGQVVEQKILPNKLKLRRVRAPLGVIFFIFESRPNVITEAFSLAFKSGNILILKGGKESRSTSGALYRLIQESLQEEGVSPDVLWGLEEASREVTDFLMQQNQWIDVLIPRGGEALIEHVTKNSRIPLIKNDRGLCHLYVHEQAQLEMAQQILLNAKTQRPGVCNAVETLLIDHKIAADFLPIMHLDLRSKGVEFYVCEKTEKIMKGWEGVHPITSDSFQTEYLDLKLNVKWVESLEEAITHIENYGSRHSEAIITENEIVAQEFIGRVDAAVVYWNASTRFTDGGEFGMGGEMGISTQKLHVRGPVGMEALTSLRWIVEGSGQTR